MTTATRLARLPRTAGTHFQLLYFAAVARLREVTTEARVPFLRDYRDDIERAGLAPGHRWAEDLAHWEGDADLPMVRLRRGTGLSIDAMVDLFVVGLVEEDARFGSVFETLTGGSRPTAGLLQAWWPESRSRLQLLGELGLVEREEAAKSLAGTQLAVPPLLWAALRGEPPDQADGGVVYRVVDQLIGLDDLILPEGIHDVVRRVPDLVTSGSVSSVVVRGPAAGGRRTVLGAVAKELGRGVLELRDLTPADPRWTRLGPLSTLLGAMPVAVLDLAPGDRAELVELPGADGPVGIAIGRSGGLAGSALVRSVVVELGLPGRRERVRHWAAALGGERTDLEDLASWQRMTGGHIRRSADASRAQAALAGRAEPSVEDIASAVRDLHRHLLEGVARRVPTVPDWNGVAVRAETMRDLELLEARCRYRDQLMSALGPAATDATSTGVRALFRGPSGTGKTLAARTLAGVLGLDLHVVDLASVVNKYLGETEKNLDRLFARAEETGVVLLLDEGDALLTSRTAVQTSNDRYANLETNFLLQRLDSFEGVVIITTNAGERIDTAFERRMDVVVDFTAPDEQERWWLWGIHLPDLHDLDRAFVDDLAVRCPLTGAQIRNAVMHATLLALDDGSPLCERHLALAVRREFGKVGRICPIPVEVEVG